MKDINRRIIGIAVDFMTGLGIILIGIFLGIRAIGDDVPLSEVTSHRFVALLLLLLLLYIAYCLHFVHFVLKAHINALKPWLDELYSMKHRISQVNMTYRMRKDALYQLEEQIRVEKERRDLVVAGNRMRTAAAAQQGVVVTSNDVMQDMSKPNAIIYPMHD